jgi:hypothetical protein
MNLEYYGYLDDLVEDTDTNNLIDDYPETIEAFATSSGFRYSFEEERADYWEGKGGTLVQEMVKESNDNTFTNIEEGIEPEKGAGTTPRRRFIDPGTAGYS